MPILNVGVAVDLGPKGLDVRSILAMNYVINLPRDTGRLVVFPRPYPSLSGLG